MRFNERSRLDTSEIRDRRSAGGRRGPVAAGAGGLGIVGVIIVVLMSVMGGGGGTETALSDLLSGQVIGDGAAGPADNAQLEAECATGADANSSEQCLIVGSVNSVQDYWEPEFDASGLTYTPAATNLFTGSVSTACGGATSAVGPFYCPADQQIYVDLGFFDELTTRFGASGGDFAKSYVIAHEYGHHVQNLLGVSAQVQRSGDREGADSGSVRLELQADCYAGAWAHHASTTVDPSTGQTLIAELTDTDIADGLSAAAAVGDDRIQSQATGRVDPESWTHGSAEQRQRWFLVGFDSGNPEACDTFATDSL